MDVRGKGFSLVEMVIVVVVIGLLAVIALPRFSQASKSASMATMKANLDEIQKAVDLYHAEQGIYPATIDPSWFISNEMPPNVYSPDNPDGVEIAADASLWNPISVVVSDENGCNGYWYNPQNGVVRGRVTYQGSDSLTVAYYLRVNNLATME